MGDNLSKLDGVKRIFLILYCMIASCSFAYAFGVDSLEYVVTKNSEGNPAVYVKGLTSRGKSAKLSTIYVPDGVNIYTLSGILVRAKAKDTKGLKPGVYVAGGRRIAVK